MTTIATTALLMSLRMVFVVLLVGTILLVALLTFVPALLLGPIVQSMTSQLF